jgi:hypothetical protein
VEVDGLGAGRCDLVTSVLAFLSLLMPRHGPGEAQKQFERSDLREMCLSMADVGVSLSLRLWVGLGL